jgi:uncharacterized membrane protein YhaH (DUF805 family)
MFQAPFSFEGRIRRTEYGISFIIYFVVALMTNFLITTSIVFVAIYIPTLWFFWAQGAKRCHDRNNSGWFQIIPLYPLWLLFGEGDFGPNDFGHDPKEPMPDQFNGQKDILDSDVHV